jgi:hypothetical protein
MAGDTVNISPTAQLMIHRSSTVSQGNADNLSSDLEGLNSTDQAIVNVYQQKTGMDPQDIYRMMSQETWINAQDAVKQGFADSIMFEKQPATVANAVNGQLLLSKDVISKVKTLMRKAEAKPPKPVTENKTENDKAQLKEKLSFLFAQN